LTLRDRLRKDVLRETADRRVAFFLRFLLRGAFPANAAALFATVRKGFFRDLRRECFLDLRARTACMTPPALFTSCCHLDSFRRRRDLVFPPGLSVASHRGKAMIRSSYPLRKSVILFPGAIFVRMIPASGSPCSPGIVSQGCFQAPLRFVPFGMM
jgi:hypothetical protein